MQIKALDPKAFDYLCMLGLEVQPLKEVEDGDWVFGREEYLLRVFQTAMMMEGKYDKVTCSFVLTDGDGCYDHFMPEQILIDKNKMSIYWQMREDCIKYISNLLIPQFNKFLDVVRAKKIIYDYGEVKLLTANCI